MSKCRRKITEIGMPYHGVAVNGSLSTPGGSLSVSGGGDCILVRHPAAPGAVRNALQVANDTAAGREWRDYALLCGASRAVNGGPAIGADAWLYCDAAGATWVVRAQVSVIDGTNFSVTVTLESVFGRFGRDYAPISKVLTTTVYSASILSAPSDPLRDDAAGWVHKFGPQPSPNGSRAFLNIYSQSTTSANCVFYENTSALILSDVIEVALAGSGDIEPDALGAGITASLTRATDYGSHVSASKTVVTESINCDVLGTYVNSISTDIDQDLLWRFSASGDVAKIQHAKHTSEVETTTVPENGNPTSAYRTNVRNYSETLSFGGTGHTYSSTFSDAPVTDCANPVYPPTDTENFILVALVSGASIVKRFINLGDNTTEVAAWDGPTAGIGISSGINEAHVYASFNPASGDFAYGADNTVYQQV